MPRRRAKRSKAPRRGGGTRALSVQQTVQRTNLALLRAPRYTVGRMPGIGLPDELHCTLQYAVQQTFTSTTGGSSLQDFRGNDCYDPDATSTGTQPAWFDALMTIYKYGCVKASRIVANCKMLTSTNPGTMIVCPVNSQAELDASLLTNPMAAESMMNLNQAQFTFDMAMKSNAMAGLKSFEQYRASVNHWFSASASPSGAHNWFWRLAFRATDGTSTSVCYVDARIYYDVVLFHRNVSDEDLARPMKPQAVPERKTRRPSNVSCDKGDEKYEPGDFELIDNQDNVIARLHQTTRGPQLSHLPAVSNSKSREAMLSGVRSQSMK